MKNEIKKNLIEQSLEMDNKQSFTDKIYNTITIGLGVISIVICVACLISFFVNQNIGINIWLYCFYPLIVVLLVGFVISTKENLRNRYFSSVLSITLLAIGLILFITIIIIQIVVLKKICVIPSTMPLII